MRLAAFVAVKQVLDMSDRVLLTDMDGGDRGIVVEILGGRGVLTRLRSLGIRKGVTVAKVSAHFGRGPVVVQVGGTQAALGFRISEKVVVEIEK